MSQEMSLLDLLHKFPNDAIAEVWFTEQRWPDGIRCAHCESDDISDTANHPTMPYHCRSCRKFFSAKTNSVMHASKLGYQKWVIAIYLITTKPKGISSLQLSHELSIKKEAAWHMLHRIRDAYAADAPTRGCTGVLTVRSFTMFPTR